MASGNNLYLDCGKDFPGTAKEAPDGPAPKGMAGKIEIESWAWGMTQHAAPEPGKDKLQGGTADLQHITFTHASDLVSPLVMDALLKKKELPEVTLYCWDTGEPPTNYLAIKFKKAYVSHLSTGGANGAGVLTETFSFTFGSFELTATDPKKKKTTCVWPA
jgi:type VI protein secretion system component Hcp